MKIFFGLISKPATNKQIGQKPLKTHFQRLLLLVSMLLILPSCGDRFVYAQIKGGKNTNKHSFNYPITPTRNDADKYEDFMHISLNGSIVLKNLKLSSIKVAELSGIAWDKDEQLLYAVSDEGLLYHLKLSIKKGQLKSTEVILATRLKGKSGQPLKGKLRDSEGLSIINGENGKQGDSKLIISFENQPRIAYYSPKGNWLSKVTIPKRLEKTANYRDQNKALESVTTHPKYGILTASEYPLKIDDIKYQSIYSNKGKVWHFPASKATNSAITGIETLENGDLLVLERAFLNPFYPLIINLRQIKLNSCDKKRLCETKTLARFDGSDGWLLDNFEGLTHLKGNQYLMVSDNNQNPFQRTIMVLFEINPS